MVKLVLVSAMVTGVFMAMVSTAHGQDISLGVQPTGRSVGEFITADGRFDLDEA